MFISVDWYCRLIVDSVRLTITVWVSTDGSVDFLDVNSCEIVNIIDVSEDWSLNVLSFWFESIIDDDGDALVVVAVVIVVGCSVNKKSRYTIEIQFVWNLKTIELTVVSIMSNHSGNHNDTDHE